MLGKADRFAQKLHGSAQERGQLTALPSIPKGIFMSSLTTRGRDDENLA